ncbi:MAG TPA: ergothioneine biosynthesis protein EgtB [Gemmatimonadaceae bacterium]|nr:ergothioneine biosynthesis protein EgtB [Gemmatimonadaceae bacterium]
MTASRVTTSRSPAAPPPSKQGIADLLAGARERTLLLISGLSDEDLHRQHDPLMSPIIWDVGHIAHFEELWLTQNLDGAIEFSEMPGMYNPFEHPRATRASLPLPTLAQMMERLREIRERVLDHLESLVWNDDNPLLQGGYVYNMVLQHEYQHNETILQTLQLKKGEPYRAPRQDIVARKTDPGAKRESARNNAMISFPGGRVTIGTNDRSAAYDNERPRHEIDLRPFLIDRTPVTNDQYLEFIADRGYKRTDLWSDAGRRWLAETGAVAPRYWFRDGDAWFNRAMDVTRAVDPSRPVCHVCYHEAEAFAKWSGKRLPTEFEWEAAASWDPSIRKASAFPWGDSAPTSRLANVDQLSFDTAPVDTYDRNVSPVGCYGMIGDVWEWTSTDFNGYHGFQSFPYKEYSEEFFGSDYKVLRGGSWATRPGAIRNTFRNWDYPIRRQIFSGFRCARNA